MTRLALMASAVLATVTAGAAAQDRAPAAASRRSGAPDSAEVIRPEMTADATESRSACAPPGEATHAW